MDQQVHKSLETNKSTRFLTGQLRLKNQKVIFFIGAGVSSSSGLPLGDTLRDKVLKELLYPECPLWKQKEIFQRSFYPEEKDITLEMVLQQVREKLGYDGISDFLKPVFNKIKEPSFSHEILASLAKKGFISLILTTNFDNLLEEALKREEVSFKVISGRGECVSIDQHFGREIIIWKIHGTFEDPGSIVATKEDVYHFPPEKQKALCYLFQNYNIVFVGYSMRDPDIMEVIDKVTIENKKYSFFWVDPVNSSRISKNIQDIINRFNLFGNYIQMFSDNFFNELNYHLYLRPPFVIWNADEAILLRGGVRGRCDPWNRDCPPHTRIFGAAPNQENYVEWEGASIRLQRNLLSPLVVKRDFLKGAALRIEIPPIDGKGIHGREGGKVSLFLITDKGKFKLSELVCEQYGYFETWWPHDDRYRGIYPEFFIDVDSINHFEGLQNIILELEIESQVCMDVSRFLLYFF